MKILSIKLLHDDDKSIVQLDVFEMKTKGPQIGISPGLLGLLGGDKNIIEWMLNANAYFDPDEVTASVQYMPTRESKFQGSELTGDCKVASYILPSDPVLALDFLAGLDEFVRTQFFQHIVFSTCGLSSYLTHENDKNIYTLSKSVDDIIKESERIDNALRVWPMLVDRIIANAADFPVIYNKYNNTFTAFMIVHRWMQERKASTPKHALKSLVPEDLKLNYRIMAVLEMMGIPDISKTSAVNKSKADILLQAARTFIGADKRQSLNILIDHIGLSARIRLCESCHGKAAYDGDPYDEGYTEFAVIKSAKFTMRPDGRISLPLGDNAGYMRKYAVGKRNHGIMQAEFKHLANVLDLEFASDTDFHQELIFTDESTQKLCAIDVQYNREYLKQLLIVKNTAEVLKQGSLHAVNAQGMTSWLCKLPHDVLQLICNLVFVDTEFKLFHSDRQASIELGWNRLFFQPATNCWAEFSIDASFSRELGLLCDKFATSTTDGKFVKPGQHHVSLLFGFARHEAGQLIDIVKRHLQTPLTLTAGEITRGDISPVILLHIEPSSQLDSLFWELYNRIGYKKHSLINSKYDPHITIAISDQSTLDNMDLSKYKDLFKGRAFTIDNIFAYDEDAQSMNILLDSYCASSVKLSM